MFQKVGEMILLQDPVPFWIILTLKLLKLLNRLWIRLVANQIMFVSTHFLFMVFKPQEPILIKFILFQKISISQLVLKYALCVALIKCSDYKHITEAVTILLELIESGYANKLPSLYLALGKAYFSLNRFVLPL